MIAAFQPKRREIMANKRVLTKEVENIEDLKSSLINFQRFIDTAISDRQIVDVLEKLGRFTNNDLQPALLALLSNSSVTIRALTLKNLAKYSDANLLEHFSDVAMNDISAEVRREATSAIGRLRNPSAIQHLLTLARDKDPNIVLQSLRGLSGFMADSDVLAQVREITAHQNDQVSEYARELVASKTPKKTKMGSPPIEADSKLRNLIIKGDTLDAMVKLPDESVHLTFTSPPYYNARDYSIYQSYQEYLSFLQEVFKSVHRITKEGRFLIVNSSPIIVPRISRAHSSKRYPIPFDLHAILVKMGWEYVDDIIWLKPEASVKNRIGGFMQHRKPLGYKPNTVTEMLMVYRKKTAKLLDWNMKQYEQSVVNQSLVTGDFETTNVWKIDPTYSKKHSAVFPIGLCDRVIRYYSYAGDLIFDPFAGSGTVGISALANNRSFLLTELDDDYNSRIVENILTSKFLTEPFPNVYALQVSELENFLKGEK